MIYKEMKLSLFDTDKSYALAHCISAEGVMDTGFKRRYPGIVERVSSSNPFNGKTINYHHKGRMIFNLITKNKHSKDSTYESFESAIWDLKVQCKRLNIRKIAIPFAGEKIDNLDWSIIREIIKKVFEFTNIEILVCHTR